MVDEQKIQELEEMKAREAATRDRARQEIVAGKRPCDGCGDGDYCFRYNMVIDCYWRKTWLREALALLTECAEARCAPGPKLVEMLRAEIEPMLK